MRRFLGLAVVLFLSGAVSAINPAPAFAGGDYLAFWAKGLGCLASPDAYIGSKVELAPCGTRYRNTAWEKVWIPKYNREFQLRSLTSGMCLSGKGSTSHVLSQEICNMADGGQFFSSRSPNPWDIQLATPKGNCLTGSRWWTATFVWQQPCANDRTQYWTQVHYHYV